MEADEATRRPRAPDRLLRRPRCTVRDQPRDPGAPAERPRRHRAHARARRRHRPVRAGAPRTVRRPTASGRLTEGASVMTEQPPGDPLRTGRREPLSSTSPPAPVAAKQVIVDDYPMTKAELADRIDRHALLEPLRLPPRHAGRDPRRDRPGLALQAKDDADNSRVATRTSGLRSQVNQLQDDVNSLQKPASATTQRQSTTSTRASTASRSRSSSIDSATRAPQPAISTSSAAGLGPQRHASTRSRRTSRRKRRRTAEAR